MKCWWCCYEIESQNKLNLPYTYDEKKDTFKTLGYFCSWSCMKTYALDKYGITRGSRISGNIVMMRKKLFNKIGHITPAPNRYALKDFGGNLTIDEFRKNVVSDDEKSGTIKSEEYKSNLIPINNGPKKMHDIKNANSSNDQLKLKRNKPLKRNTNNLESVLGLKFG